MLLSTTIKSPLSDKTLASDLRARLIKGYAPDSHFARLVARLSDEELVRHYLAHRTTPQSGEAK